MSEMLNLVNILDLLLGEYRIRNENDCEMPNPKTDEYRQFQETLDNIRSALMLEMETGHLADAERQRKEARNQDIQAIKDEMANFKTKIDKTFPKLSDAPPKPTFRRI